MKFKIIPVIFAVMLCLSAVTLVNAQSGGGAAPAAGAQDPTQGAPQRRGGRREGVQLTDAQKAQLKTIHQGVRSQIQALRNDKSLSREDLRSKIQAIRQGSRQQFIAVLTPEQQQAMKSRFDGRREGRQGEFARRGPGGRGAFGRGAGGMGGFAALGLSEDQQAKLKAIHQGTRSQMEAVRNDSSLSREQRQEKIKSIFENTRQQTLGVLTPEQQQKLQEGRRGPGRFGPRGRRGGPDNAPPNKP